MKKNADNAIRKNAKKEKGYKKKDAKRNAKTNASTKVFISASE